MSNVFNKGKLLSKLFDNSFELGNLNEALRRAIQIVRAPPQLNFDILYAESCRMYSRILHPFIYSDIQKLRVMYI